MLIIERSIAYESFLGILFILINLPLISTMTLSPRVRYHYGLIVVAINVVISLICSFLKYQKMKEMDPYIEVHEEYLKMREYYQFLGFKFMHATH